jgi:hypothetical protein
MSSVVVSDCDAAAGESGAYVLMRREAWLWLRGLGAMSCLRGCRLSERVFVRQLMRLGWLVLSGRLAHDAGSANVPRLLLAASGKLIGFSFTVGPLHHPPGTAS